ncbi:hypothetical protein [Bdellovibrio sp. HCB209]|uniref:hypothetical protein n=1 Tax=Bdellovibrio sp. HCB209 TaxID=3394354 RepID=UPI0039B5E54C
MKSRIAKLLDGSLVFIKHNIWAGLITLIKAFAQLILLKYTALQLGQSGIGIFGQAFSVIVVLFAISNGGITNTFITSVPSLRIGSEAHRRLLAVTGLWGLTAAVLLSLICWLFGDRLATRLFSDSQFQIFFYIIPVALLVFSTQAISQGTLSAQREVKKIFFCHLVGLLFGVIGYCLCVSRFGELGIGIGAVVFYFSQAVVFSLYYLFERKDDFVALMPRWHKIEFNTLLGFSVVMLVTGSLGMCYQVFLRTYLNSVLGMSWSDIGDWQALLKLSEISMSFIGVTISTSYLPTLSGIYDSDEVRTFVEKYALKFFALIFFSCAILIALAPIVLHVVYSKDFVKLAPLMRWQICGDLFRLGSWLFTYFFLAKLSLRFFVVFEVGTLIVLSILSLAFSHQWGVPGLIAAHVATSISCLGVSYLLFKKFSLNSKSWRVK